MLSKNNVTVNRLLLTSGIVGPLCTHAGDDRRRRHPPGYNAWTMAGSSLSLSSYGWTQIANFIISGLLLLCFAAAAKASLPTGRGRFSCPHRRELKPVILSEAKDLSLGRAQILRFAQDDSSA